MIRVWYSNQLEKLSERLIENLKLGDDGLGGSLFAMPPVVVPNRNIETYLRYEIARGAGIAAGLNFYVPERFQDELLSRCQDREPEPRRLHSAVVRAYFLDLLSDQPSRDSSRSLPDAVRSYLDAAGDNRDARDLHRFQLAGRLARLMHRYNDHRPDLLRDWRARGASSVGKELGATEEWQRSLWHQLGALLSEARPDQPARWIWPLELLDFLGECGVKLPTEIHVFGFSYLSHGFREMIERLGRNSGVDLYTFAPVDWRAVEAGDAASAQRVARRAGQGRVPADRAGDDDESIAIRWGQPGRHHFAQLDRLEGVELRPELASGEATTTLGRLQAEILVGGERQTDEAFQRDESLVILACPGIRREAEIVANEIWRLIRDDDSRHGRSSDRLRFPDVAVLVADSANLAAYQAHFRAVLEELYDIPFNMVDLPLAGESRLLEAVLLLLDLPLGEFTRPEVLKILTHPAVQARFPQADAESWRSWCVELEVVHGADRADHRGTYIDREVFHWDQGLRRLALGALMTGPRAGDERAFELDGAEYLPFDVAADALPDVARLLLLVRSLAADARFARSAQLTMTQWSHFFTAMVEAYLAAEPDGEQRVLAMCLHEIRRLRQLDVTGQRVDYRIAQASLREAIEGQTAARGYYLADGVVVSPLREMRALPFRVIFLCGLGEGRFPVRADVDPLDLSGVAPRPGDVSPRDRDKYLFLETLACARARLYLSYVARDAQTGDDLSPSPMLEELMRDLHRGRSGEPGPAKFWVDKQPLRRFDEGYFDGSQPAGKPASASFSAAARQEWRARELRRSLPGHGKALPEIKRESLRQLDSGLASRLGLCPLDGSKSSAGSRRSVPVSLSDIRKFLECPLQGWARVMLRLHEDEEEDESQRFDEHFVTGRLRETGLLRAVFLDAIQNNCEGSIPEAFQPFYRKRAQVLVHQGLLPVGLFGEVEKRKHLDWLAGWHHSASEQDLLRAGPFGVYRFGRAAEAERVERVEPTLMLDVKLPDDAEPWRVEIFGRTEIVAAALPGSLTPVGRTAAKDKDFLRGFLDSVVLSLLPGHHDPAEYHAHVIPLPTMGKSTKEPVRTFRKIDESSARGFLTTLLADLLGGPHAYLLPCEAVFNYLNPKKQRSIEETVEDMKENERAPCSSRYGPVPDFERYDPPDEDEAHAMIERRFGLFRDSGGMVA
ncbi:MAG: exodeoxyribonuclease V subunit gamma [Isosphaeraceae bacterium]